MTGEGGRRSHRADPTRLDDLELRPFAASDLPEVLVLLQRSLGWLEDADHERYFLWKHRDNPFGSSPAWVAVTADGVVGFRTFMRWGFVDDAGSPHGAVRAVDTATHPDHRGRGIFSALTLHALAELESQDVEFVFNTPNDQSRPGYLKMGWEVVGRPQLRVRPRGAAGTVAMLRARVPAERWSLDTDVATPAPAVLADRAAVEDLLSTQPSQPLATHRTADYLAWRYGLEVLKYRAIVAGNGPTGGLAVFRLRRRGQAVEAAVCELIAPGRDARTARSLLRDVVRVSGADYALALAGAEGGAPDILPLPRQGPVLTHRPLAAGARPRIRDWRPSLGDIELF